MALLRRAAIRSLRMPRSSSALALLERRTAMKSALQRWVVARWIQPARGSAARGLKPPRHGVVKSALGILSFKIDDRRQPQAVAGQILIRRRQPPKRWRQLSRYDGTTESQRSMRGRSNVARRRCLGRLSNSPCTSAFAATRTPHGHKKRFRRSDPDGLVR
jgi:hypothetical protein